MKHTHENKQISGHECPLPLTAKKDILCWLKQDDPARLEELYARADGTRKQNVGDEVHLRGLLEISNHCVRACAYCGLNVAHRELTRYRMTEAEIMDCVREIVGFGYGTVVMQAGEDYGIDAQWMADIVRRIKAETPLTVTLSLGERPKSDFALWKEAGASRYLLRFETSDRALYDRIHPPLKGQHSDRFAILRRLREIGYEIGSGVMIGIPRQTYESLANDIALFRELDLDMIGVGPYLPHPATSLGHVSAGSAHVGARLASPDSDATREQLRARHASPLQEQSAGQVPNSEEMTYKVIALARLVCPQANIPSTTALATLNTARGRELGLSRGANIVMPNVTPAKYRRLYEIYPGKACINETAAACQGCMQARILSIGRTLGKGPGGRTRR